MEVQNVGDAARRRYTYEKRVWRKTRIVPESGFSQDNVRWPSYVLGKNEEVRGRSESYKAAFASAGARRYTAKVRFDEWKSLRKGTKYRLGRNVFGRVRTVTRVKAAVNQRRLEQHKRDS